MAVSGDDMNVFLCNGYGVFYARVYFSRVYDVLYAQHGNGVCSDEDNVATSLRLPSRAWHDDNDNGVYVSHNRHLSRGNNCI